MSETSPTSEPSVANTGAPIKSAVISAASMSILPGGSARMAVGTLMVMLMAVASVNTTPRGCPSFAPTRTQRFMVYDAFFPHTAINSARVTLSLLANEAGSFCLKLPISLALRTPSLSRSAALNCSVHCFSSMGVAFWACKGNDAVAATRNRGTIRDIGTPLSMACRPPGSKHKRTRHPIRSVGFKTAGEREREPVRSQLLGCCAGRVHRVQSGNTSRPQGRRIPMAHSTGVQAWRRQHPSGRFGGRSSIIIASEKIEHALHRLALWIDGSQSAGAGERVARIKAFIEHLATAERVDRQVGC